MELNLVSVNHRDSKNKELNEDLRFIIVAPHNQEEKSYKAIWKQFQMPTLQSVIKKYKIFKIINLNDILLMTGNKSAAWDQKQSKTHFEESWIAWHHQMKEDTAQRSYPCL